MKRYDLVNKNGEWKAQQKGRTVPGTSARRKADAVKKVARKAKADSNPTSVRIHKLDGKIQDERTYPRKADPPGSKG